MSTIREYDYPAQNRRVKTVLTPRPNLPRLISDWLTMDRFSGGSGRITFFRLIDGRPEESSRSSIVYSHPNRISKRQHDPQSHFASEVTLRGMQKDQRVFLVFFLLALSPLNR